MLAAGQDQAFGQPVDSQLRSCLIATRPAESMGLAKADRAAVYWVALLRHLGCTGHVVTRISVVGDERAGAFRLTSPRKPRAATVGAAIASVR